MMLNLFSITLSLVTFSNAFISLTLKSHDEPESISLTSSPQAIDVSSGPIHFQMGNLFENDKYVAKKVTKFPKLGSNQQGKKHFPLKTNILGRPEHLGSSNVTGALGVVNPVKPVAPGLDGSEKNSNLASALAPGASKLAQYLANETKAEDAANKTVGGAESGNDNPGSGSGKFPLPSGVGPGNTSSSVIAKPKIIDQGLVNPQMTPASSPPGMFVKPPPQNGIGSAGIPGNPSLGYGGNPSLQNVPSQLGGTSNPILQNVPNQLGRPGKPPLTNVPGQIEGPSNPQLPNVASQVGGPSNPQLPNVAGQVGGPSNPQLPNVAGQIGEPSNPPLQNVPVQLGGPSYPSLTNVPVQLGGPSNPSLTNGDSQPELSRYPQILNGAEQPGGSEYPQLSNGVSNAGFANPPALNIPAGPNIGTAVNPGISAQQQLPSGTTGGIEPNGMSDLNNAPWKTPRLPSDIAPLQYTLIIRPNLTEGYFEGYCGIVIEIKTITKLILLHSYGLNYTQISVSPITTSGSTPNANLVTSYFLSPELEYLVLVVESGLQVGVLYQVHLEFHGYTQDEKLVGLYRSRYTTKDGQKRFLALTKFQPTDARRMFPCFDEPAYKAKFLVSVIHDPQYTALGNMPVKKNSVMDNGLILTEFSESVLMSTYLVAIIVSDFQSTPGKTKAGTEVRVYARAEQLQATRYAVEVAVMALDFFAEYFGIPYPLPKSDLVAIPDFKSGAMENWGLISFRETSLLYDPQDSSMTDKESATRTTIHELGHMWFGNLVTMKWWDDLWLNEGFARFTEQLAAGTVQPKWQLHDEFVNDVIEKVMIKEEGSQSHPIVMSVNSPADINAIFDSITYEKGASVIYMLEAILGSNSFRTGLQNYLKSFAFGNTVTLDLWNKFTDASNPKLDVGKFMDTWTKQEGFPVVFIKEHEQYPQQLIATQQRFFSMPNDSLFLDRSTSPFNYLWELPLTYINPLTGTLDVQWLHQSSQSSFQVPASNTPIKFNVNSTGYYRVNYEEEIWLFFAKQLMINHHSLTNTDRANLLDDVFSLSKGGYTSYQVAFELVKYLPNEEDYVPLNAVVPHLLSIARRLEDSDLYPLVRQFAIGLLMPIYQKLGWQDQSNSYQIILTRTLILKAMCTLGYQPCISEALNHFQQWKQGRLNLSPDLRALVYKYGIKCSNNVEDWEFLWAAYKGHMASAHEKNKFLTALAATREPWLIRRLLSYMKDPTMIRGQDFFKVFGNLAENDVAVEFVWEFLRTEWQNIVNRFSLTSQELGRPFSSLAASFNTPYRLREMEDFITRYPEIGAGQLERKQALDKVKRNIEWINRCSPSIKQAMTP